MLTVSHPTARATIGPSAPIPRPTVKRGLGRGLSAMNTRFLMRVHRSRNPSCRLMPGDRVRPDSRSCSPCRRARTGPPGSPGHIGPGPGPEDLDRESVRVGDRARVLDLVGHPSEGLGRGLPVPARSWRGLASCRRARSTCSRLRPRTCRRGRATLRARTPSVGEEPELNRGLRQSVDPGPGRLTRPKDLVERAGIRAGDVPVPEEPGQRFARSGDLAPVSRVSSSIGSATVAEPAPLGACVG